MTQWLPDDQENVRQIVGRYCSEISDIEFIEHGHDNLVVCVNQEFVFRFPRNEKAARRLRFEVELLEKLKGKITSVPISEVIDKSDDPLYAVMRFHQGEHLNEQQISELSDAEQEAIGHQLGEFIAEFSSDVSVDELSELRQKTGVAHARENWQEYFARVFRDTPLPDEKLRPLVDEYYAKWQKYSAEEQGNFPIHDDIHPANILFAAGKVGVLLDFCDATTGSIEEEMRGLYRMGDKVLRAAIARYAELTGRSIDYEHVRVWVITNELARFTRYLGEKNTDHPIFKLAQANLRNWLPNFPL